MKQNKRGFTLIELLAVIVILAIIALIAVPVIMNIISSARKSAFEDTAYGIIKAGELYYASALLNDGMEGNATFTFDKGKVDPTDLKVQGSLPDSGAMIVTTDGKVAIAISNGTYCVTKGYDESKIKTDKDDGNCKIPEEQAVNTLKDIATTTTEVTSVATCATSGTCAVGTKFAIEVAPGDIKNFYVVSDVDNKVTLIMDRNIDETTVAWGTSHASGPITALNYLENQTSGWTNIEAKNYTLTDDNTTPKYTIERTNARARMLTKTEADAIISNEWVYGNLSQPLYGYWTSSAVAAYPDNAWLVRNDGGVYYDDVNSGIYFGVRPVIEISK